MNLEALHAEQAERSTIEPRSQLCFPSLRLCLAEPARLALSSFYNPCWSARGDSSASAAQGAGMTGPGPLSLGLPACLQAQASLWSAEVYVSSVTTEIKLFLTTLNIPEQVSEEEEKGHRREREGVKEKEREAKRPPSPNEAPR